MLRSLQAGTRALPAALSLAATVAFLGACGSDESEDSSATGAAEAPPAAEFPEPEGSMSELVASVGQTDQIVASPAGGVFEPGDARFGFGLFDVGGAQITDADTAIYAAHGADGEVLGPFPARVETLRTNPAFVAQTTADDDAKAVFVAEVPFKRSGEWRLAAVIRRDDGHVATNIPSVVVRDYKDIPEVGDRAPSVHTPTIAEVGGNVEEIDTRKPPSSMHEHDLADVLGEQPVVLLFATPALCMSRVCGPVVDIAEQVKAERSGEAAFIHQEIYVDNVFDPENLRPPVERYGLFTEPWLFVIDERGRVATRIEGAFSASELEQALDSAST